MADSDIRDIAPRGRISKPTPVFMLSSTEAEASNVEPAVRRVFSETQIEFLAHRRPDSRLGVGQI